MGLHWDFAGASVQSIRTDARTCLALDAPTRSVRRVHPPAAGMRPIAVSGSQKRAEGPTMRTSHARAHSNPPATAAPCP